MREREQADEERGHHARPQPEAGLRIDQDRVDRAPPADRHERDRHAEEREDRVDGGEACAPRLVFHRAAQHEVGDEQQEHDRVGREPRVPGPPRVPRRLGPDRAAGGRGQGEDEPDLRGGDRQAVPQPLGRDQVADARDHGHAERQHAQPGARHVKIDDPLRRCLICRQARVHRRRRDDKRHVRRNEISSAATTVRPSASSSEKSPYRLLDHEDSTTKFTEMPQNLCEPSCLRSCDYLTLPPQTQTSSTRRR